MRELSKYVHVWGDDKALEILLKKLGYHSNQIFSYNELMKKSSAFYKIASEKEMHFMDWDAPKNEEQFLNMVLQLVTDGKILQTYYRFISKKELKNLKGQ